MKPCPLCGVEHWPGQAHDFSETKPDDQPVATPAPTEDKPRFDRRAYQREYMAKRRAKQEPQGKPEA